MLKVRLHPEDVDNNNGVVTIANRAVSPSFCIGCWYQHNSGCSTAKSCSKIVRHDRKNIKWVRIN